MTWLQVSIHRCAYALVCTAVVFTVARAPVLAQTLSTSSVPYFPIVTLSTNAALPGDVITLDSNSDLRKNVVPQVLFGKIWVKAVIADARKAAVTIPSLSPGAYIIKVSEPYVLSDHESDVFRVLPASGSGASTLSFATVAPSQQNAQPTVRLPIPVEIKSVEPKLAKPGEIVSIRIRYLKKAPPEGTIRNIKVLFSSIASPLASIMGSSVRAVVPGIASGQGIAITLGGDLKSIKPWTAFSMPIPPKPVPSQQAAVSGPASVKPAQEKPVAPEQTFATGAWLAWLLGTVGAASAAIAGYLLSRERKKLAEARVSLDLNRLRSERGARMVADADSAIGDLLHSVGIRDDRPATVTRFEIPQDLAAACASGGCVMMAGPGLSAQSGLPTWTEFVSDFLTQLETEEGENQWGSVQAGGFGPSRPADSAVDLVLARGKSVRLYGAIAMTYGKPARLPADIANFLAKTPLLGVLTTNFDNLIETAAAIRRPQILTLRSGTDLSTLLRERRFFVLKLNGDVGAPETLDVRPEHFAAALEETPYLKTFVRSLFAGQTMLFAGMSCEAIEWLLSTAGIRYASSVKHYALVPLSPDFNLVKERIQARYNLELIGFAPSAGFPEMPAFFAQLASATRVQMEAMKNVEPGADVRPAKVQRLRLHNIGPFENATFDFASQWTVLLGNNGCGKSTILRAIALALSGDDEAVQKHGLSLLRTGTESGWIEIQVDSTIYRTRLVNRQNSFSLTAEQGTGPLQSRSMVVLGIPAVRGAAPPGSTEPKKTDRANYPRVEDVLPLIRGGADTRMSNVRQWIVNTYVRSEDKNLPEKQRKRHADMLRNFFAIVDDMVPGFQIQFASCNTETFDILLKTSDGILPMDYISQGMLSTIAWAGVLLQRLYEIYADREKPTEQYALLLIDEIDSHLHPEWQQLLVPQLRKHFPGLQIIGTTHSPLLVGSLRAGEIVRIRRHGGLNVEAIGQSFMDYRADQILTTEAFSLESSRSWEWQQLQARYAELLAISERNDQQEKDFQDLAAQLREAPRSQETEAGRTGAQLVDDMLRDQIVAMTSERPEVIQAALKYLGKVVS